MSDSSTNPANAGQEQSPVSRSRRAKFVFFTVGFSVVAVTGMAFMAGMGVFAANIALVQVAMDGLNALSLALGVAYITGSVVDYNGGFGGLLGRSTPASAGDSHRVSYSEPVYTSASYTPAASGAPAPGEFFVDRHPDLRAGQQYDNPYAQMAVSHDYPDGNARG